ncbi:hypothetical protein POPTR_018G001950v4 [Populus trichocarpa]|uniref:Uncharacterized protein n=1 Tax=Populus trichocarpa TaxID=3694 RepID=B9NA31_POPTR|nr:hypothetical protein POPTR_018G001950v4 [Populus trichocarpa]
MQSALQYEKYCRNLQLQKVKVKVKVKVKQAGSGRKFGKYIRAIVSMENHERRQKKEGKERENRRSIESTSNEKPSGDWLTDLLFSLFLCFCLKIFFLFFFSYNIIISDFVLMMEMKTVAEEY